jgi:hypothetical protein
MCSAGVLLLLQVANYCVTKLAELNVPLCTHEVAAVLLQAANYCATKLAVFSTHEVGLHMLGTAGVLLSHHVHCCCYRLPVTV